MKRAWIVFLSILTILLLLFVAFLIYRTYSPTNYYSCNESNSNVYRIIDGDTFVLKSGEIIRLLCVNTPEKGQAGYEEATNFLNNLISCKEVILNSSNYNGNNTDKYGRLLRWVYVKDDNLDSGNLTFVNKLILDEGYGDLMVIPPEKCNEITD